VGEGEAGGGVAVEECGRMSNGRMSILNARCPQHGELLGVTGSGCPRCRDQARVPRLNHGWTCTRCGAS